MGVAGDGVWVLLPVLVAPGTLFCLWRLGALPSVPFLLLSPFLPGLLGSVGGCDRDTSHRHIPVLWG